MNKKVLLIGGAGYVGSELTKLLLLKNYEVTVYDLFIYGDVFNPYKNNDNLKIIKGDIRDLSYLDKVINNFHYIIHLACISNDPSFDLDPDLGKSVNFDSFEDLVKISKNNGVKRFIYASSSSVYGIKSQENVDESCSLEPITDYSKYKALCEEILFKYNDKNFISTILRPATVCGYSDRQRLDLVVNILTNHAYHNKNISVFGGNQLRPNIHIKDMCRAYLEILNADQDLINGQIFNVGFENHSVKYLANLVRDCIDNNIKIKELPSEDDRSYHISSRKIQNIIGFENKYSVRDAIMDLKYAFSNNLLTNTFANELYFNIKRMNSINLK
jgi:nucleoside-diphosphate-sugar epimerase